MNHKLLAFILAAGLLLGSLCACGGATPQSPVPSDEDPTSSGADHGNEITVGIAQDLDNSLDPYKMTAAGTREVMFNVFEGLIKPDQNADFVCAVASDYTVSEDGLDYTFTLRDGVIFHDGTLCTMDDILYSLETCAAVTVNASVAEALSAVTEKRVEGDRLTLTLSAPDPDFLSYLANVYIVPKDYDRRDTHPIGTGPFKYVSRSVQENFILEKHGDYYGEGAKLDRVTYRIYEDNNAMFTALDSGALDLVAHLTIDQVNALSNGYEVEVGNMNLVQAIYLNNAVKPFDDVRVRQALCYAVDVDAMMLLTNEGHGTKLGSSMYPAFTTYFDPELANAYPHDVEKAKALLAEAGYPDGIHFTIAVPSNYGPHVDSTVVLVEQLKQAGIRADIRQVEWETWKTEIYAGRNFEATVSGFDATFLNAGALLARFVSDSGKNFINYSNAEYDAVYAAARAAADPAEQTALYKRCLEILSETAANVYTQDLADFVALAPGLKGFAFYPLYVIDMSLLYWAD